MESVKRPVKVFGYKREKDHGPYSKVPMDEGLFVQYGLGILEGESSLASYTTAIVEMPDGTVQSINLDMIQFTDV